MYKYIIIFLISISPILLINCSPSKTSNSDLFSRLSNFKYCNGNIIDVCISLNEYSKRKLEIEKYLMPHIKKISMKSNFNKEIIESKPYTVFYNNMVSKILDKNENIIFLRNRNKVKNILEIKPLMKVNYYRINREISLQKETYKYINYNFKKTFNEFCRGENIPVEIKEYYTTYVIYNPISGGSQIVFPDPITMSKKDFLKVIEKSCMESGASLYKNLTLSYKKLSDKKIRITSDINSNSLYFDTYDYKMDMGIYFEIKVSHLYKKAKVFFSKNIKIPEIDISGNILLPLFYLEKNTDNDIKSIIIHEISHLLLNTKDDFYSYMIKKITKTKGDRNKALSSINKILDIIKNEEEIDLQALQLLKYSKISITNYVNMLDKIIPKENIKERKRIEMLNLFKESSSCPNLLNDIIKYITIIRYLNTSKSFGEEYHSLMKVIYITNFFNLYSHRIKSCNMRIDSYTKLSNDYIRKYLIKTQAKEYITPNMEVVFIFSFNEIYKAMGKYLRGNK